VPLAIIGLLSVHLAILWRQKHTQFRGRGREEHNVVGSKLWPTYAMKSVGLFALVVGVLAFLGGLVQINPVWLYGPYQPAAVSTAAQPDWYLGWVEGAIRLFPPWSLHVAGGTVPEVFWPSIALPSAVFVALYAWPFLEARVTHDRAAHHLLDHPSDRPVRTAIGVGALTFFVVLTIAGGQDIVAQQLGVGIAVVANSLRVLTLALPFVTGLVTWKICREIRASGRLRREEQLTEPPVAPYETPPDTSSAAEPVAEDVTVATPAGQVLVSHVHRGSWARRALLLAAALVAWIADRFRRR
jgi:ubiquinol-cytochrome c reductase cytochrome b subunit